MDGGSAGYLVVATATVMAEGIAMIGGMAMDGAMAMVGTMANVGTMDEVGAMLIIRGVVRSDWSGRRPAQDLPDLTKSGDPKWRTNGQQTIRPSAV